MGLRFVCFNRSLDVVCQRIFDTFCCNGDKVVLKTFDCITGLDKVIKFIRLAEVFRSSRIMVVLLPVGI